MSTTVRYKGSVLTTVNNQTRVMKTAGKYMEDDVTLVDTPVSPNLESKSISITPSESSQSQTAFPGTGYDGFSSVSITVDPISSTYVGSGITRRDSTDLSSSGATVSVPSGYYENPASKAVASGTEGTPIATKGTVNNHSINITPSVVNSSGYISGGSHSGTPVSVSASELVSGNLNITSNGNGIDVTNYETVSVSVTAQGKNSQIAPGVGRANSSSYTAITGQTLTVAKTGTYDVYWNGYRSTTSGTSGTRLYIDDTAYGSAITTFDSTYANCQVVHLSNVSLTANQVITIRARSRGNNYYMYVYNLTIIEA